MVRILAFIYMLTIGWSTLRIGQFTIFDTLSLLMLPLLAGIWQRRGSHSVTSPALIRAAIISGILMVAATLLSAIVATDLSQHFMKGIPIALSLTLTAINLTLLLSTESLTPKQAVAATFISAVVHSAVVILQGQFGLFLSLMKEDRLLGWMRATGLMDHPIEAGLFSAVGTVLGFLLLFDTKRDSPIGLAYLGGILVCVLSSSYSASITAFLTLTVAVVIQFVMSRKIGLLFAAIPFVALAGIYTVNKSEDNRLIERLTRLSDSGSSYNTVEARDDQIKKAVARMTPQSILIGFGFNIKESPQKLDIHNGIVGMDFYFGVLGVVSQIYLIGAAALQIRKQRWPALQAAFIGMLLLFLAAYMSGPTYSRRSQWVPMLLFAAMPVIVRNPRRVGNRGPQPMLAARGGGEGTAIPA